MSDRRELYAALAFVLSVGVICGFLAIWTLAPIIAFACIVGAGVVGALAYWAVTRLIEISQGEVHE